MNRQIGRWVDMQAGRWIGGQTEMNTQTGEACRHTDMHSGEKTKRAGRQADSQTGRQADRQTRRLGRAHII